MSATIREACFEDAAGIAKARLAAWRANTSGLTGQPATKAVTDEEQTKHFEAYLRGTQRFFVVADQPGVGVVGFASYGPSHTKRNFGELMQLFIHPDWQRYGLGSRLVHAALEKMRGKAFCQEGIHIWATQGNPGNRVYDKAGLQLSGAQKFLKPGLSDTEVLVVEYIVPGFSLDSGGGSSSSSSSSSSCPTPSSASRPWPAKLGRLLQKHPRWATLLACSMAGLTLSSWRLSHGHSSVPPLAPDSVQGGDDEKPFDESSNIGVKVEVDADSLGFPAAQCLDGSKPVYYLRRGRGTGRKSWLLFFQGGGWCSHAPKVPLKFSKSLIEDCDERAQTRRGSTRWDPDTMNFNLKRLFSADPERNIMFHNWNIAFLRYCDGSSFASPAGQANLEAILHHLRSNAGMYVAEEVVVSGCSAGGLAAALNVDRIREVFPAGTKVAGLFDSGVFLHWARDDQEDLQASPGPNIWPLSESLRPAFKGHEARAPRACRDAHEEHGDTWKCFFMEYLLPHISTPSFILQSRYDTSNIRIADVDDPVQRELRWFGEAVDRRLSWAMSMTEGQHGLFLDSCFHHCMSWGDLQADGPGGPTQPEVFAAWWNLHVADQRVGYRPSSRWDHVYMSSDPDCTGDDCHLPLVSPCFSENCCPELDTHLSFWKRHFSDPSLSYRVET